jgi:hypothetical protein
MKNPSFFKSLDQKITHQKKIFDQYFLRISAIKIQACKNYPCKSQNCVYFAKENLQNLSQKSK